MAIVYTIKYNHKDKITIGLGSSKKQQNLQGKYKKLHLSGKIEQIVSGTSSNVANALTYKAYLFKLLNS